MGDRFRARRATRPELHGLEGRDVLSGLIAAQIAGSPAIPSAASVVDSRRVAARPADATSASAPPGVGFSAYSGNTGAAGNGNGLYNNSSTPLLGNGFPTPQELTRETYHSAFSGRYYSSPGRFTSQGTTYFYRGTGGSNMFLHGDFTMAIVTPADGSDRFLGEAVLNDKSTNSAGIQGLILTGSVTDVDGQGRPTKMTFTADPNIYSGAFFVEAAQGTVSIKYGARKSIKVNFDGLLYTTGLTSPLVNQDLYARQGRPIADHATTNLAKIHQG